MNRALPIVGLLACFVGVPSEARQADIRLEVVPAVVYKVDDPGNTGTSTFVFDIAVICPTDSALTPVSASVALSDGKATVERQEWSDELLAKIRGVHYRISSDTPAESPKRMFTLPEAFDLHFYFRRPQALAIGSVDVRVRVADANGRRAEKALRIPIQYYQQKTSLTFPFRGQGVVGQDWITNGGHGGAHGGVYGTDFALDARGLDKNWAESKDSTEENESAAGWGREILSPAAGTVTYERNDVRDNPHAGPPDSTLYTAVHDPIMAYFGNCVIIDHGNSEYSVMAHLQEGSVTVKVGELVAAGQVVGKLGNSGDSFGPHLHYQLQAGPMLYRGQPLPFRFANIEGPLLSRGRQFDAK
jgi:hypothetical protein